MKEIRIHARAGQGAITTANLLGNAAFAHGQYALAFPSFGAARMGAPMNAFVRLDKEEIRLRSQVYEPDYLIVVDATLMRGFDVFEGMRSGGIAIVNERPGAAVKAPEGVTVHLVPANEISLEVMGRPMGNTTLIGAFAAATGAIDLASVEEAIQKRFAGKVAEMNLECARRGAAAVA